MCDDEDLHSGSFLLQHFGLVRGFSFVTVQGHAVFSADDAEELRMLFGPIIILGADVDQLFELPSVGHGGHHLGELVFVALQNSVYMLSGVFQRSAVAYFHSFFH